MLQVLQVVGALLIVAAYIMLQLDRLPKDSLLFLAANLVGSLTLAVLALLDSQWGFLILESVWAIVSALGLARALAGNTRGS